MRIIRKNLNVLILILSLLIGNNAMAQQFVLSGKVTDSSSGESMPGVSIAVKGTTNGTISNEDGNFTLSVKKGDVIQFSYIGYAGQEVVVSGQKSLTVALVSENEQLEEVVVVAYGTRKKTDLTGSVSSVTEKEFQKGNIASPEQLLMGKVPGLQVTSSGGAAGAGSTIRIRGGASLNASNDPLIVIDGIPVATNSLSGSANLLNTINPNDIESISVLKDASATALYGSMASNGVMIITTKKGAAGVVKFNFNSQASVGTVSKYVDVLNADQVRSLVTADAAATGNNTYKNLLGTANTDWQKEVYRPAMGFDNNLSASGTVHKIPFRISTGYLTQDGVIETNHFNRFTGSLNLSPKFFTDHLSVNVNTKYSRTENRFVDESAVIRGAVTFDPTQTVHTADGGGNYGGYWEWLQADGKVINTNGGAAAPNPVGLIYPRDNTSQVGRFLGNVQLDYKLHFFPDLHVLVNLGLDKASGSGHDNRDSTMAIAKFKHGIFSQYKQGKTSQLFDASLFYTKEIPDAKSKLDVLVGHSYSKNYTDQYNYPSYSQAGVVDATTVPTFLTDKPESRMESYMGRLNYSFYDKYLLTASIRRDASSKFSPNTRVGYFPAVALAWKMKDEFFKNTDVVSDLKLRLSWGVTGQQGVFDNYPYVTRYSRSESTAQYQFGDKFYSFLRPVAYDVDIKWETTTTQNLGLDFGFFKGRISGTVDVYNKKTEDLLSVVPIAPGANFNIELLTNVGNMENKGAEFAINAIPIQTKDFSWSFGFNVTYNDTKITNLLKHNIPDYKGIDMGSVNGGTGNKIEKHAVGYAPWTFFVYKQVYDKVSGAPIEGLYEDINRDGQINDDDRYYYKKPAPDFMVGLNTQFTYQKWTLGLVGHAMIGNYLYNNFNSNNATTRALKDPLLYLRNVSANYLDTKFNNMQYLSDYYIENASFFRLDNINLGYNVGKIFPDRASELRITANVQNVFVITKYSGLDPEYSPSDVNNVGVDNVIYPRPRIYSIGFNLDF
ncbi:MAG TPA: SusC/RagA family TonB-linked outer membrane protein [Prolixibacteraceae bacterium]|jgi:iron complex outermembrane receptor protein